MNISKTNGLQKAATNKKRKENDMKNKNYSPYGTYNPTKVEAPKNTSKDEPRATKITGEHDLRGGHKK